jgi:hypothetical protein
MFALRPCLKAPATNASARGARDREVTLLQALCVRLPTMPTHGETSKLNGTEPIGSASLSSSTLLPELLSHQPQFILDDIFNVFQDAVISTVEAMQTYSERWAERRAERLTAQGHNSDDWDGAEEIEQGLVALQTLLDSHVDLSFDFFEMWALRSIFRVPDEARPVVLPHQRGLDLELRPEREGELLSEIESLRKRIDDVSTQVAFKMPFDIDIIRWFKFTPFIHLQCGLRNAS